MIARDVGLILLGAGIAMISGVIAVVVGHYLSLREDRIKRERDFELERRREAKKALSIAKEDKISLVKKQKRRLKGATAGGQEKDVEVRKG